ncbi:hypothetical protein PRBEI_2000436400 [Prionailurus iriomotensis]
MTCISGDLARQSLRFLISPQTQQLLPYSPFTSSGIKWCWEAIKEMDIMYVFTSWNQELLNWAKSQKFQGSYKNTCNLLW